MEIKPSSVNNRMRQIFNEINTSGGIRIISRQEPHHHISNAHDVLRNFSNISKSHHMEFENSIAHRYVMQHCDYVSNKENIDPNIQ